MSLASRWYWFSAATQATYGFRGIPRALTPAGSSDTGSLTDCLSHGGEADRAGGGGLSSPGKQPPRASRLVEGRQSVTPVWPSIRSSGGFRLSAAATFTLADFQALFSGIMGALGIKDPMGGLSTAQPAILVQASLRL